MWKNEYNRICNKHAPFRKIRIKKRSNPWFSQSILKAIYKRDLLHKHAVKSQCPLLMKEYQIARNNVTKTINRAKRDYYYQQITTIKKSGKLWEKLRTLLPSKKDVSKIPNCQPMILIHILALLGQISLKLITSHKILKHALILILVKQIKFFKTLILFKYLQWQEVESYPI